ncbi:hypothetical protein [Candidatus Uabimicrobium sp. HlEnr_7]|uniref:hypothetical protein n=1 Tax=Candidatus Uabimicrobium helgolandensis TaxID=3095367 RepID=UPI003555EB86
MNKLFIVISILLLCACEDKTNKSVTKYSISQQHNDLLLQKHDAILIKDSDKIYISLKKHSKKSCEVCHRNNLSEAENILQDNIQQAHFDIELNHAEKMTCDNCHIKHAPQTLYSFEKTEITHSYQLCGKCHFKELKDWRGGAHGKRLTGWQKVRVIESCIGCHNPHKPKWDKRYPLMRPDIIPHRLGSQK